MSPAESDLALLETARRCDFYGVKFHPARDIEGTPVNLAILHLGIRVYHQLSCASTFSWAKIRKLSFKRKKFQIKLHPEAYVSYQYYKDTIEFVFEARNESKAFWKKAVEHHTFFRCNDSTKIMNKSGGKLFSKGSSFKYYGRTQKQLIDYVREHHKRREPFTRPIHSSFARSARALHPADQSPAERSLPTPIVPDPRVVSRGQNGDLVTPERNHQRVGQLYHGSPPHHPHEARPPTPDAPHLNRRSTGSGGKGATTVSFHVPATITYSSGGYQTSSEGEGVNPSNLVGGGSRSAQHLVSNGTSHQPHPHAHTNNQQQQQQQPQGNNMSHSLVMSSVEGAQLRNSHGYQQQTFRNTQVVVSSQPPQMSSHVTGYLSADNDDNVSEDSYHLSDLEPSARSPPTQHRKTHIHQVQLVVNTGSPERVRKSVEFKNETPIQIYQQRSPPVPVPTQVEKPPPVEPLDEISHLYSKVRLPPSHQLHHHTSDIYASHNPSGTTTVGGDHQDFSQATKVRKISLTSPPSTAADQPSLDELMESFQPKSEEPHAPQPQVSAPQPPPTDTLPSVPAIKRVADTYGAIGPLPGKVLTRQGPVVITPESNKPYPPTVLPKPSKSKDKPVPPPKPKNVPPKSPSVDIPPQPQLPPQPPLNAPGPPPTPPSSARDPAFPLPPPAIQIQSADNPDVQHRFLLNGDVPYVLHMRHVPKPPDAIPGEPPLPPPPLPDGGKVPFSTFKDPQGSRTIPSDVNVDSQPLTLSSSDRGRPAIKPEGSGTQGVRPRKKSLELVQRKRLPSPGTFSSQDHSISPTTPESGNVVDYIMRRRSASQEAKRLLRKAKRENNRRKTQPIRFSTPEESSRRGKALTSFGSSSQPTLPTGDADVEADYDSGDDISQDSHSLHEDMDALEAFHTSAERLSRGSSVEESQCESIPPPPPPLASEQLGPPPGPFQGFRDDPSDPPFIDDGNSLYAALSQTTQSADNQGNTAYSSVKVVRR